MKRILIASTAMFVLAGGAASAHSIWDKDNDGQISVEEYNEGIAQSDAFRMYDADGDGTITQDEFNNTTFRVYDHDNDGMWSQTEAGVWEDSRIRSGGEVSQ